MSREDWNNLGRRSQSRIFRVNETVPINGETHEIAEKVSAKK